MIKVTKIDASLERKIIIGAIVSDRFLRDMRDMYHPSYLTNKEANRVLSWCLDYYGRYEKAPGEDIQDIFNNKLRSDGITEASAEFIEDLLQDLSSEFERDQDFNSDYLLDQTERRFRKRALEVFAEDVKVHVLQDDIEGAEALFNGFRPPEKSASMGIDPFGDKKAVKQAFADSLKPLFTLPGALGELMNWQLTRDAFISFLAPEKRGKSYLLQEISLRAYMQRCNVAVFEAGDLSQNQRMKRIYGRTAGGLIIGPREKEILYPVMDCTLNQTDQCDSKDRTSKVGLDKEEGGKYIDFVRQQTSLRYLPCCLCRKKPGFKGAPWHEARKAKKLDWRSAYEQSRKWNSPMKGKKYKVSVHHNDSLTVKKMRQQLDVWERFENFVPDVIVVDYPDIFAPEDGREDSRARENTRWKALRGLSQDKHCCLITATQASAGSYDKENIELQHYSEDKRKYAHVTAMYGINQTTFEKRKKMIRINELLVREADFDHIRGVKVMQCLDLGKAYVESFW